MTDDAAPERTRPSPPSGEPPPQSVSMDDGTQVDLAPMAEEICRRYTAEFPDERERYGAAGHAWCIHDNLHLLEWGFLAADGHVDMEAEVTWLARVLESRHFPLVRLARSLEIGSEVLQEGAPAEAARLTSTVWATTAVFVRAHGTFLD
jgi:hypothetical protein